MIFASFIVKLSSFLWCGGGGGVGAGGAVVQRMDKFSSGQVLSLTLKFEFLPVKFIYW